MIWNDLAKSDAADTKEAITVRARIPKLRMAFSIASAMACLLLVALWARSYWIADIVRFRGSATTTLISTKGAVRLSVSRGVPIVGETVWKWEPTPIGSMMPDGLGSWRFRIDRNGLFAIFLYRLPCAVFIVAAIAPWVRLRFSLAAALIAVAVVALVLQLVLYFGR